MSQIHPAADKAQRWLALLEICRGALAPLNELIGHRWIESVSLTYKGGRRDAARGSRTPDAYASV